jgi:SAM-dependent methyltransferase
VSYPAGGNDACFAIEDRSFWFQHRNAAILETVRLFPPRLPFFDVGGGNGCVAQALERGGVGTVLVEPGASGALNGLRRGLRHVVCSTIERAGFLPGTLPSVGLFDVIEHVPDDERFLLTVRDLMARDGRVYVTVPAHNWLWSAEDSQGGHFRRYTLRSLTRALEKARFAVEFASYFFWALPVAILLSRTIPSALRLRRRIRPEATVREHAAAGSFAGKWLLHLLSWERARLRLRRPIPFGASCIAVGQAQ